MNIENMTLVGELQYINNGISIDEKYPQLTNGKNLQFTLQSSDKVYDLYICLNFEAERLYYKVKDIENDEFIITYNILVENINLTMGVINNYTLIFKNNKFYQS